MSEDYNSLIARLQVIQQELKVKKSQYNAFGKYKYRSCEDILEAVKPLLKKHGCAIMLSDEVVAVGERIYVKATVYFTSTGDQLPNEEGKPRYAIVVNAYAREEESKKGMDGSQITGAASSYARKYALNGLFAIDDAKDSDSTNIGAPPEGDDDDYACVDCGKPFSATTYRGKSYSAEELYRGAISKYGIAICKACAEKPIEPK